MSPIPDPLTDVLAQHAHDESERARLDALDAENAARAEALARHHDPLAAIRNRLQLQQYTRDDLAAVGPLLAMASMSEWAEELPEGGTAAEQAALLLLRAGTQDRAAELAAALPASLLPTLAAALERRLYGGLTYLEERIYHQRFPCPDPPERAPAVETAAAIEAVEEKTVEEPREPPPAITFGVGCFTVAGYEPVSVKAADRLKLLVGLCPNGRIGGRVRLKDLARRVYTMKQQREMKDWELALRRRLERLSTFLCMTPPRLVIEISTRGDSWAQVRSLKR